MRMIRFERRESRESGFLSRLSPPWRDGDKLMHQMAGPQVQDWRLTSAISIVLDGNRLQHRKAVQRFEAFLAAMTAGLHAAKR